MKNELSIEEILWKSVFDIEKGEAKTFLEDPIDGLLNNKKLNKMNVCLQSGKYNKGIPISRPTLDKFKDICEYIDNKKTKSDPKINELIEENEKLKLEIKREKEFSERIAQENYRLNELLKDKRS